jgi:hypothetical protein
VNELLELLQTPVYGALRVKHLLELALAAWLLWSVVRRVFPKERRGPATTGAAVCPCGWKGQASLHAPRCPRCGKTPYVS